MFNMKQRYNNKLSKRQIKHDRSWNSEGQKKTEEKETFSMTKTNQFQATVFSILVTFIAHRHC